MNYEPTGTVDRHGALYQGFWRWHFYAALIVIPFLLLASVSGMLMLASKPIDTWLQRELRSVTPRGEALPATTLLLALWSKDSEKKLADGKATAYGLGFQVGPAPGGRRRVWHGGSQEKTRTALVLYPDEKLGLVVMTNSEWATPVVVTSEGIGRYGQDVEAAVYFSCLEALQNVAKYASASGATIELAQRNGSLEFAVTDDGKGFDPASAGRGSGLQGMADRLDAIGGELTVESRPGSGTTVRGTVPI